MPNTKAKVAPYPCGSHTEMQCRDPIFFTYESMTLYVHVVTCCRLEQGLGDTGLREQRFATFTAAAASAIGLRRLFSGATTSTKGVSHADQPACSQARQQGHKTGLETMGWVTGFASSMMPREFSSSFTGYIWTHSRLCMIPGPSSALALWFLEGHPDNLRRLKWET